jgi:hypothetical protein
MVSYIALLSMYESQKTETSHSKENSIDQGNALNRTLLLRISETLCQTRVYAICSWCRVT